MAAYAQQSIGLGTVPNDDTGDDLRTGGDKINDNFDEIFGQITFEAAGPNAITYDGSGNNILSKSIKGAAAAPIAVATNGDWQINGDAAGGMNLRSNGTVFAYEFRNGAGAALFSIATGGAIRGSTATAIAVAANGDWQINGDAAGGMNFKSNGSALAYEFRDSAGSGIFNISNTGAGTFSGDVDPAVTETLDLGSTTKEWNNLFVQNAPTVSDKRRKNDLGSASDLIPVMKLLKPRVFSFKSKTIKDAIPAQTLERQKTEIVQEQKIEIINGVPVLTTVDVERSVFKMVTVKDASGNSIKDKKGKVVKHPMPVMENYTAPAEKKVVVSHGRPHTGFMAQDVKQAMDDAGVTDWAGYAYHDEEGEDTHVLRLSEFISPILAYVQELEGRIKTLEGV